MYKFSFLTFLLLSVAVFAFGQKNKVNPNGYNIFYYDNGKISSQGTLVNGKPDKYWKSYYTTGVLKTEGNRKNFQLDSLWSFYDEKGELTEQINYRANKRNGFYFTYKYSEKTKKNELVSKELYLNDDKFGKSYFYYPNLKLKSYIEYERNMKHGKEIHYDTLGRVTLILHYNHGNLTESEQLNRFNREGLKQGTWKEFYPDGNTKIYANYKNGNLHGYYREYNKKGKMMISKLYENGKEIELTKENKLHSNYAKVIEKHFENGNIKSRGAFINKKPIGFHNQYNEQGEIIATKEYTNEGILKGVGIINKDSKREGEWKFLYPDGKIKSFGNYKNGRKYGTWTYLFDTQGVEQKGNFINGRPQGSWFWKYENGNIRRTGFFDNGYENGKFIEYNEIGDTVSIGNYLNGKKQGLWKYNINGFVTIGNYKTDLKIGEWKKYFHDGTLAFVGSYENNEPNGEHIFYFPSGKKKEIQIFASGVKTKVWKTFMPNGAIETVTMYKNNQKYKIDGRKVDN